MKNKSDTDSKIVWICDYCKEEFKTKKESDKHELVCDKNPDNFSFPLIRNIKKSWLILWITTMVVFAITVYINSKLLSQGLNLFNKKWFLNLFFGNIILGIFAFFETVLTESKDKKKIISIIKYSFIFSLIYLICNTSVIFSLDTSLREQKERSDYLTFKKPIYNNENIPTSSPTVKPTLKPIQILNNNNILRLINQYRQQNGLEVLTRSEELCKLAEQRASYLMADRMSAYRSSDAGNHSGFSSSADGYSGNGIGENIGANIPPGFKDNPNGDYSGYTKQYKTNQDAGAVSQWVHSPPHNALLLVNEKDGVKVTKGCVAHRIEDYAMLTVLLVGDK